MAARDAFSLIFSFPKLKGSVNYRSWEKSMKGALEYEGLVDILEETYPPDLTEEVDEAGSVTRRVTAAQTTANTTKQKDWKQINYKARSAYEDKPREHIDDISWAGSMWVMLKEQYQETGFNHRHTIFRQLVDLTIVNCNNSVDPYITTIRAKQKELKRMGVNFPEWLYVSILLYSLDGKYKEFVHRTITTLAKKTDPDFEILAAQLQEEERLSKKENNASSASALAAQLQKFKDKAREQSRSRDNKYSRGGDNNRPRPKPNGKNPNDKDYIGEGDPPECKDCSKGTKAKHHWRGVYWTLYPDQRPLKAAKRMANSAINATRDERDENNEHEAQFSLHTRLEHELDEEDDPTY